MITARLRSGEFSNPPYTAGSPSSASVTVNDNDDPRPSSPGVPPSRGPRLSLPSSVSFTITDGGTSTKDIGIENIGGTGTIQVTSITTNVAGLTLNKTSFTVAANSSEDVELTFTSTTTGTRSGSITVVSSAGTATISVSVTVNPIVTLATLTTGKRKYKEGDSGYDADNPDLPTYAVDGKLFFNLTASLARNDASLTVRIERSSADNHYFWHGNECHIVNGPQAKSYTHTFSNSGTTETVEIVVQITRVNRQKTYGSLALEITSPLDTRTAHPREISVTFPIDTVNLD